MPPNSVTITGAPARGPARRPRSRGRRARTRSSLPPSYRASRPPARPRPSCSRGRSRRSLSTCCQPSFDYDRAGRVEGAGEGREGCANCCWAGSVAMSFTPQLSLIGTQVTIHGWLRSRLTKSSHSRVNRAIARCEKEDGRGVAPEQQAEPVGPVEESWVLGLLVDAGGVEAERKSCSTSSRIRRCRQRRTGCPTNSPARGSTAGSTAPRSAGTPAADAPGAHTRRSSCDLVDDLAATAHRVVRRRASMRMGWSGLHSSRSRTGPVIASSAT